MFGHARRIFRRAEGLPCRVIVCVAPCSASRRGSAAPFHFSLLFRRHCRQQLNRISHLPNSRRISKEPLGFGSVDLYLPQTVGRTLVTAEGDLCLRTNATSLKRFLSVIRGVRRK